MFKNKTYKSHSYWLEKFKLWMALHGFRPGEIDQLRLCENCIYDGGQQDCKLRIFGYRLGELPPAAVVTRERLMVSSDLKAIRSTKTLFYDNEWYCIHFIKNVKK